MGSINFSAFIHESFYSLRALRMEYYGLSYALHLFTFSFCNEKLSVIFISVSHRALEK